MSHRFSFPWSASALAVFCAAAITGCGGKDVPAKTVLTDQDKQQIEELNKQRLDEWGKPIK
jgi:hypothetical protein